jgi:peroxiredoxin
MKHFLMAALAALTFTVGSAHAEDMAATLPMIGKPAPAIVAKDTNGADVSLDAYKGKVVVLEWTNNECPFVRKHYDSKNMQDTQKYAAEKGAVWISVVSSAPEKQGHVTPEKANEITTAEGATLTHKILDETGVIGRAYGAKTTPHMFVIDASGNVAYMGAIDSDTSFKPEAIKGATNYVRAAIDALTAGTPVATAQTEPYGCGVKY